MHYYSKYIKRYWKPFFTAIIFLTLEAMCDLMQPTIMSKIVDVGVAGKNLNYIMHMGGLMLLITAVGALAACTRNVISSTVSQKFGTELRSDLFKKIQSFSFDNVDKFEGASLVTRLTNDVTQVQNFVNGLMRIFVKAPLLCIGSIIMAARLNAKMSIILIAIVPAVSLVILTNLKVGFPFFIKVQNALDKVNGNLREYLSGVRVVKAFNRFSYETERFEKSNDELGSITTSAMRVMAVFSPAISLIINIGIVLVLYIGGYKVSNGSMHVGQIIAFTNYMTQILSSLTMISFVFTMFIRARASAIRIGEVFEEDSKIEVPDNPLEFKEKSGRIDFENVSFSYSGNLNEPVLKNITFSCMPGETVGIIGSTGSGKTTIVSLIPRFYDTTSGVVKVDGVDVKSAALQQLKDKIAVVPQKSVLFTGTVAENIKWGKKDASDEEIEKAAKMACAHDFIVNLPEGYNTLLGQGGVNFSGGQKQRVSIARALIKNPEILILDDCTSAVDVTTEAKIRSSIKKYSKNLTCIIIAQRITSVMDADKIVVLNEGKITAIGNHEQLMGGCEIYREIFRSQLGKEMM
jgi:ATP-binding cassette subfamily B multidrug efflux pump